MRNRAHRSKKSNSRASSGMLPSPRAIGRPRLHRWTLIFIVLFTIHPLLAMFAASAVAETAGCPLDEGGPHVCIVLGSDWGGGLYNSFVMGWLAMLTLPLGTVLLVAWLVLVLAWRWTTRAITGNRKQ